MDSDHESIFHGTSKEKVTMECLPMIIYDLIIDQFTEVGKWPQTKKWLYKSDVPDLKNLRLVSRRFHEAVSPILFRKLPHVFFASNPYYQIDYWHTITDKLLHPSSRIASKLKSVIFIFCEEVEEDEIQERKEESLKFTSMLTTYMQRLVNIESLGVIFPETYESKYSGWGAEEKDFAPNFDIDLLNAFSKGFAEALVTAPPENLTKLRLYLPSTHEFVPLSLSAPDSLWKNLRELDLWIKDATGPGGDRSYLLDACEEGDFDDGVACSNLQQEFPNKKYEKEFFDIVARCTNLEVLDISCTHMLDANYIS